jgi:hypothetical protein
MIYDLCHDGPAGLGIDSLRIAVSYRIVSYRIVSYREFHTRGFQSKIL